MSASRSNYSRHPLLPPGPGPGQRNQGANKLELLGHRAIWRATNEASGISKGPSSASAVKIALICSGWATKPWGFKIILGRPHARFNARLLLVWWVVLTTARLVVEVESFQDMYWGFTSLTPRRDN